MVRVGFIKLKDDPSISKLALDISSEEGLDADVRSALRCVDLPLTDTSAEGKELNLVVMVNTDGRVGPCLHAPFMEEVPNNVIEEGMDAIYMMEALREIYGGHLPVGPWSLREAKQRSMCTLRFDTFDASSASRYLIPTNLRLYDSVTSVKDYDMLSQYKIAKNLKELSVYLGSMHPVNLSAVVDASGECLLDIPTPAQPSTSGTSDQSAVKKKTILRKGTGKKVKFSIQTPSPIPCENGNFQCPVCSKTFNSSSNCRKHSGIHSKEKMACTICGYKCSDPSNFKRHCERHEREKTYKCEHCNKVFYTAVDIKAHEKTHENIKKTSGPCILKGCSKLGHPFKDLCKHIRLTHKLNNLQAYFDRIRLERALTTAPSTERCQCREHALWIWKWVGDTHNCSLCECFYVFRRIHATDKSNARWIRACKYIDHTKAVA